ncbi:hypothetical protein KIF24_24810 [Micromonospora sp. Llam7]|uniref:hypothetical protein n=1 Tax=Micromonospora tarapacensis TaxID=2835305 RepID=UPI001C828BF5|nr:hypothetical protein [Micromonospora tarapacensis]MBX7268934.1 hypothetical protein [Micromonospora tarapacensis]
MGMPNDRSELQSVIDFFATPLIVDVLLAVRDGRLPQHCPELCTYGDAIDTAIAALTAAGTVTGLASPSLDGQPLLILTHKGRKVCELVERVVDFKGLDSPTTHPADRVAIG